MQAPAEQHYSVHTMLVVLAVNYNSTSFIRVLRLNNEKHHVRYQWEGLEGEHH